MPADRASQSPQTDHWDRCPPGLRRGEHRYSDREGHDDSSLLVGVRRRALGWFGGRNPWYLPGPRRRLVPNEDSHLMTKPRTRVHGWVAPPQKMRSVAFQRLD